MDFQKNRDPDSRHESMAPVEMIGLVLKSGTFLLLLVVGLKLTFWAVDIVDELLHRPDDVAILLPLLASGESAERSFSIERGPDTITIRDHNAASLLLLGLLLLVLFGAIGRAIAALLGGAVRLITSHDFKRKPAPPPLPNSRE